MELGLIKSLEDLPLREPYIVVDGSDLSNEARKQLKKIKKMTRHGLLYDKNYTKRKKTSHEDLSEDSDSEKNNIVVQLQSQAAQEMRSDSFDDEFFDDEFVDVDEADDINVKPLKEIEEILDTRYIEDTPQYFVKWHDQPDCAGEWCFLKDKEPPIKRYLALSSKKKQVIPSIKDSNYKLLT